MGRGRSVDRGDSFLLSRSLSAQPSVGKTTIEKMCGARFGPVSKDALIEQPTAVADAKIFAEPLQSATALMQPVRLGEELQR